MASSTNIAAFESNGVVGLSCGWWMKARESSIAGDIFGHHSTANTARRGYFFMFNNGLQFRTMDGAGAVLATIPVTTHRSNGGAWEHWAITFRTNEGYVRGYKNGKYVGQVFLSRTPSSDGLGTTQLLLGTTVSGQLLAQVFDVQIQIRVGGPQLGPEDIPLLMNPKLQLPNMTARYFGTQFRTLGASGIVVDETGNGHNLTGLASPIPQYEEPPYLPTYV